MRAPGPKPRYWRGASTGSRPQVYGFVKQSRGHVKIYSELGEGTTIKLYLPRWHSEEAAAVDEAPPPAVRGAAGETVLVVEDDPDVRSYATDTLRELGYDVLEAESARAALELIEHHPEIRVLFTDVGLPGGMNGPQLADAARALRSGLKVVFTSGYARCHRPCRPPRS
jgi:CheY-like chemotaxis protein